MSTIKTLNISITKLSRMETVRYTPPAQGQAHGVYTIQLATRSDDVDTNIVQVHMSLEALMQLEERIKAARQHMITH